MYVAISLHTKFGAYCGQGREGKKNTWEKLALGSRECLEKPEWMSSPKHCAQLDHATHAGSLSPRAPRTPSMSSSLPPCPRMAATSCRTRRPRALCTSLFPASGPLLILALVPVPDPLPSFFFWGHSRPHASLVERTLSPLLYSPPACTGSVPWPTLSPQHEPIVYPIHAVSTSGALLLISIRHYKMPLVLALRHPHPSRIQSRATRSSPHCGTRFV